MEHSSWLPLLPYIHAMSEALMSKDRSQTQLENKNIPPSKQEGHPETRKQTAVAK